jgi:hypothetical protein
VVCIYGVFVFDFCHFLVGVVVLMDTGCIKNDIMSGYMEVDLCDLGSILCSFTSESLGLVSEQNATF